MRFLFAGDGSKQNQIQRAISYNPNVGSDSHDKVGGKTSGLGVIDIEKQ